ncbi:hypothetical protein FLI87_02715 [Pseudomonas aeruginosa]|uniref:hypothetical protein n=1 Tax=Pseudomonas aeruginosa TaxID=287 RepID=UPI00114FE433|nr:hypothetical protein [Pseudomonas aeruginosa]TQI59009.1 hypothetical protein FLI87_02715 [Pseudomonas aeruginosa]
MTTPDHLVLDASMRSAFVTLARRLAIDHGLDLQGLACDLETLADAQSGETWQMPHRDLAGVLRYVAERAQAGGS